MTALDILISFDTTGSMASCLAQVRREVGTIVKRMFKELPDIRVSIIGHGDYCDAGTTYVTKTLDFSSDIDAICRFITSVGPTGGGDAPECYELVLHEARSLSWGAGREKILVMIGDDVPHRPDERQNTKKLDWRNELRLLTEAGIKVYGVHAMPGIRRHSKPFYTGMAEITGGLYLTLDQLEWVGDMIMGITAQQSGNLGAFEDEVRSAGRMNRGKQRIFDTLAGRAVSEPLSEASYASAAPVGELRPVPSGRFQIIPVGERDIPIKECVLTNGATFKVGRGFYEWSKAEEVQAKKEVVLQDRATGEFFSGDRARQLAGLPIGMGVTSARPPAMDEFKAYVQSTSANRKLKGGTTFLYEIEDWDRPSTVVEGY